MRMRRVLKSLDRPIRGSEGSSISGILYQFGPFIITRTSTLLLLVTFRVFLYLMTTAALVLAVEFPCQFVNTDSEVHCHSELQRFHLCIYFVVISISTVGYGDIVAVTDLGRMVMIVIVIGALTQVPIEMESWKQAKQQHETNNKERHQREEQQQRNLIINSASASVSPSSQPSPSVQLSVPQCSLLLWCESQLLLSSRSSSLLPHLCSLAGIEIDQLNQQQQCHRFIQFLFSTDELTTERPDPSLPPSSIDEDMRS